MHQKPTSWSRNTEKENNKEQRVIHSDRVNHWNPDTTVILETRSILILLHGIYVIVFEYVRIQELPPNFRKIREIPALLRKYVYICWWRMWNTCTYIFFSIHFTRTVIYLYIRWIWGEIMRLWGIVATNYTQLYIYDNIHVH